MTTTRTHFTFRVDTWAPDSEVRAARMDKDYLLLKRAALAAAWCVLAVSPANAFSSLSLAVIVLIY